MKLLYEKLSVESKQGSTIMALPNVLPALQARTNSSLLWAPSQCDTKEEYVGKIRSAHEARECEQSLQVTFK